MSKNYINIKEKQKGYAEFMLLGVIVAIAIGLFMIVASYDERKLDTNYLVELNDKKLDKKFKHDIKGSYKGFYSYQPEFEANHDKDITVLFDKNTITVIDKDSKRDAEYNIEGSTLIFHKANYDMFSLHDKRQYIRPKGVILKLRENNALQLQLDSDVYLNLKKIESQ